MPKISSDAVLEVLREWEKKETPELIETHGEWAVSKAQLLWDVVRRMYFKEWTREGSVDGVSRLLVALQEGQLPPVDAPDSDWVAYACTVFRNAYSNYHRPSKMGRKILPTGRGRSVGEARTSEYRRLLPTFVEWLESLPGLEYAKAHLLEGLNCEQLGKRFHVSTTTAWRRLDADLREIQQHWPQFAEYYASKNQGKDPTD